MMNERPPVLRTLKQAQDRLAVGRWKIYELVKQGQLEKVKLGGSVRITERSIEKLERAIERSAKSA